MTEYYEVIVEYTACDLNKDENMIKIDDDLTKCFVTLEEVITWIDHEYAHAEKGYSYVDIISDGVMITKPCGCVFIFNNSDIFHNSEEWYQEDWVTIHHIKSENVFLTGELPILGV